MKQLTDAVCVILREANHEINTSDGSPDCQNRINQLLSDAIAAVNASMAAQEATKK